MLLVLRQLTSSGLRGSVGGAHGAEHHGGGGAHHAKEGGIDWLVSHRTEKDWRKIKSVSRGLLTQKI